MDQWAQFNSWPLAQANSITFAHIYERARTYAMHDMELLGPFGARNVIDIRPNSGTKPDLKLP